MKAGNMFDYSDQINEGSKELIERHLDLVIEANKTTNITRIDGRENGLLLHVEDSLAGLSEINKAPEGLYGDMGTGAGYPGIPVAIATRRHTVLIESIGKKANLLREFITDLGIDSYVDVFSGRLEELALECPCKFAVLSARALSQLSSLVELASPLLALHGHLVCYKARIGHEELEHVNSLQEKLGMRLISERRFVLSDEKTYRTIVVFEKVSEPTVKLPRRNGMAQKKPY